MNKQHTGEWWTSVFRCAPHDKRPNANQRRAYAHGAPLFFFALVTLLALAPPPEALAQSGLRKALEELDKNDNGFLEPHEITPLARPYLERITKRRGMGLERPQPIDKLQEAARIYYAIQNGVSGEDVQPKPENNVKGFGPERDKRMVAGFGLGRIKYKYNFEDLQEAEATIRRYDYNRDGLISRAEALRSRWTHRNPFDDDINKDDQLSKMELTQRYARRRMLQEDASELVQRARRVGNGIKSSKKERKDESQWWRRGGSSFWLTASLMGRFDANRNGRLELEETRPLGLPTSQIDLDGNGEVERDELFELIKLLQDKAGDATAGLPGWFYEMDANRDGQVALSEFAAVSRKLSEFRRLDANKDGLLTAKEASTSDAVVGGQYRNARAEVLPPKRTVISEIEVEDDYLIGDLNVQISITHTNVGFLDAFLTSPDGQRIELFTEVGGGGDHFQDTIFDDEAPRPVTKGRPPFEGSYRTKGPEHKQPGLWAFDNKSVKGVWQLVVRGSRSERFGMLHNWSLIVKPKEDVPERTRDGEKKEENASGDDKDQDRSKGSKQTKSEKSVFDKFKSFARSQEQDAKDQERSEMARDAKRQENARKKAERKDEARRRREEARSKKQKNPFENNKQSAETREKPRKKTKSKKDD